ncbi:hypothetical protein CWI84_09380 [Idiomarina tyrosinivorans]|uniref:Flagellar biosynthesis protein FlaG n=1 Tax=Idiomarina tyrosinivorans TaxID=1445662 RepID=A0A432ZPJ9_9GAMM|nr:flagellar protein FlaG [Idiomarina tyrosinivorans]RUO79829.1 hypothetical protein CWI84_09380 [Idiomarina tyrosinivorans]
MANITLTDSAAASLHSQLPPAGHSEQTETHNAGLVREQLVNVVSTIKNHSEAKNASKDVEMAQSVQSISKLKATVKELNESSLVRSTSLQFLFDEKGEPPVVRVLDKNSGEEIRQIPSEVVQKIAKAIEDYVDNKESSSGILLDQQA